VHSSEQVTQFAYVYVEHYEKVSVQFQAEFIDERHMVIDHHVLL